MIYLVVAPWTHLWNRKMEASREGTSSGSTRPGRRRGPPGPGRAGGADGIAVIDDGLAVCAAEWCPLLEGRPPAAADVPPTGREALRRRTSSPEARCRRRGRGQGQVDCGGAPVLLSAGKALIPVAASPSTIGVLMEKTHRIRREGEDEPEPHDHKPWRSGPRQGVWSGAGGAEDGGLAERPGLPASPRFHHCLRGSSGERMIWSPPSKGRLQPWEPIRS